MPTNWELLRRYSQQKSQEAFTALVNRHLSLVYSAALRLVQSPSLAEDVAQSVFIDLARNANKFRSDTILSAWLYRVAYRTAVDVVRKEPRRQNREQQAVEMAATNSSDLSRRNPMEADWTHIEPLLDEGMQMLGDADRAAVLLRYFENKSLREVGQTLGTSEDAAQKRVSRAVERLRDFFAKRGLAVGAGGLVVAVSANAVQAAPAGLAVAISSAAVIARTTVATTATVTITKAIAMTTLQKTIIGATLAAAIGTGIYEARRASRLCDLVQTLQQQQAPLTEQIQRLQHERDDAMKRLATSSTKPTLRLPAPPMQVTVQPNASPTEDLPPTNANLYDRFKDKAPMLTVGQVEAYLKANGRIASSLLAAYRTGGDPALLKEAMEKYPNDPQVAFEAVLDEDLSPKEQRQWLNAFEKTAPDNALANYLSAFNYFNSGQIDQGVQEVTAASGKQFNDYTLDRAQDDEEAYLSAGYSAAEAERISDAWLDLSQLHQVKLLGEDLVDLAKAYSQSGDQTSAQAAFQMAMNLGQRYSDTSTDPMLINQLVGMTIEKIALSAMDPNSPYGDNGQTVQDQLNQLAQQRAAVKELVQQTTPLLPTMSDQDILNYENRRRAFGEVAALQWVVSKYGQK